MKKLSSNVSTVMIFTKGADSGQVKTRLSSYLTQEQCLSLHFAFIQDTCKTVSELEFPASLYVAGNSNFPFSTPFPIIQQNGNDLGARLKNAFETQFLNFKQIVVIGTDSPDISASRIQEALLNLQSNDVVIGPSEDGGYYLLGLSRMIPEVFEDIPWGTNKVMQRTVEQVRNYNLHLLESHYDVDVIQDLIRLAMNLEKNEGMARYTKKWFEQNKNVIIVQPNGTQQNALE